MYLYFLVKFLCIIISIKCFIVTGCSSLLSRCTQNIAKYCTIFARSILKIALSHSEMRQKTSCVHDVTPCGLCRDDVTFRSVYAALSQSHGYASRMTSRSFVIMLRASRILIQNYNDIMSLSFNYVQVFLRVH